MSETAKLERGLGLVEATSLNMTFMVGIGPFVVIPFVIQAMGGPGSLVAWAAGAMLAIFDGCIWAELGAAMPEAGGSYVYLREAYGKERWGRLISFLYIWQTLFQGPLSIASGALGFATYSSYLIAKSPRVAGFVGTLGSHGNNVIAGGVILLVVVLLYRKIADVGRISVVFSVIVVGTILWIVWGGARHFDAHRVFDSSAQSWSFSWLLFAALGHGMVQTIYSYLGYYNVCNLGAEMKNPQKNIPRAIFISIIGITALYLAMQASILTVIPWREAAQSSFIVSTFIERVYGSGWATLATALILVTALGSVFAAMLGYSRVPYAAALDGNFFSIFARVHRTKHFPYISLLALGAAALVFSLAFSLISVIRAILAMRCIIQFIGQGVGLILLHRRWDSGRLPFRMWLYPVPVIAAICGWAGIFVSTGRRPMLASLAAATAGILVYLGRARWQRQWPFEEVRVISGRTARRILVVAAVTIAGAAGWMAVPPAAAQSVAETVQSINKARVATRILYVTAHPDDETAGLLAYLSRGLYADVAILTLTRGQGGQNAVGPEQDAPLGVLRTTELLAADSHYGVHQYFTRAIDPGFSKSPERTMKIWGTVIPLEDMVRVIRMYRPDVVINGWGGEHSGHGQHQASGLLTPEAVADAADPSKFPEQISQGLVAWKVSLELRPSNFGFGPGAANDTSGGVQFPINDVSPLWGQSYVEMGMDGHAQHRSQGTPSFYGNPFARRPTTLIVEHGQEGGGSFDVKLMAQSITSLGDRFAQLQSTLAPGLAAADQDIAAASKSALELDRTTASKSLAEAGKEIADLHQKISSASGDEVPGALWELDGVKQRIDTALANTIALPVDTQANRHELVAGETFTVDVNFLDKSAAPVKWSVDKSSLVLPEGWSATLDDPKPGGKNYHFTVSIPAGATPPSSPSDDVLPFPPPLVMLALRMNVEGYEFTFNQPVQSAEAKTTEIAIYPLELVPAVTLTIEPSQVMVPEKNAAAPVNLLARVRYHGTKPATVSIGLDAPPEWNAAPIAPLNFTGTGDQLIRYVVKAPAKVSPGAYVLHPYARIGSETFATSVEPIPSLPTRNSSKPSDVTVHLLDLTVPAGLHIGYIAGDIDLVPETLRQVGIQVDMLDELALAFGDLSRYDAIVVGIRAYELRPDVYHSNPRLLDYAHNGGTLLVLYERDFAWPKLLPAPFKAEMASTALRVTDADSPVRFLAPDNPVLNTPNKITLDDFKGWVQERGVYFWSTWDPVYQPILGLTDAGEPEATGGLVYARDGKGVYIYSGLSFFRELPNGVPGAYRLFVNLLSQTRHSAAGR